MRFQRGKMYFLSGKMQKSGGKLYGCLHPIRVVLLSNATLLYKKNPPPFQKTAGDSVPEQNGKRQSRAVSKSQKRFVRSSDHQTGPWDPMIERNIEGVQPGPGVEIIYFGVSVISKEHLETL